MLKGGYKIIDFADVALTTAGAAVTIEGVYEAIEASYRKPLLLSGLNIDGTEKNDVFATPTTSDGNYVFTVYGKTITVTAADAVTVANA